MTFATRLAEGRKPQTVGNYLSHLSSIFSIARPTWGMPLDPVAIQDAQMVLCKLNAIAKYESRSRAPLKSTHQHALRKRANFVSSKRGPNG